MASARLPDRDIFYHATERFVNEGLRKNGSLFVPGESVWHEDVMEWAMERSRG